MAEGHARDRWSRTAQLCAVIANCHRDPKKGRPLKPADFDPFDRTPQDVIKLDADNIGLLRQAFLGHEGQEQQKGV